MDWSKNPQEQLMEPLNIRSIVSLERGYQIYKSSKNDKHKQIQLKSDFNINFENMIVSGEEGDKEYSIYRKDTNKVELN